MNHSSLFASAYHAISEITGAIPQEPQKMDSPIIQAELGVVIGIVGDLKGRMIVETTADRMKSFGLQMYGMPIMDEEMLESFAGEFGNTVAGSVATKVFNSGIKIEISPPTVIRGQASVSGFSHSTCIRVDDELSFYIALEDKAIR